MTNALHRIKAELKQLRQSPEDFFEVAPDPQNVFNIHFSIRGPILTPFSQGLYHGVILLPQNYPFDPPDVQFYTENGRFEVKKNICVSFTSYHPETWSSSWGIRAILTALRSAFDEEMPGAVGSITLPEEQRRQLAAQSLRYKCDVCGIEHAKLPQAQPQPQMEAQVHDSQGTRQNGSPQPASPATATAVPPEHHAAESPHTPTNALVSGMKAATQSAVLPQGDRQRSQLFLQKLFDLVCSEAP